MANTACSACGEWIYDLFDAHFPHNHFPHNCVDNGLGCNCDNITHADCCWECNEDDQTMTNAFISHEDEETL